jgi:hypothetical protein
MRMTSMSDVRCRAIVTLERFNMFGICFPFLTEGVWCRFRFDFWGNRTVPSRSTVKGHMRFKYITSHVTYRWKGLVKSFPTICNLWQLWPLYDLQGRFWGQLPHHVRCRWKGLVNSFLTMHKIRTVWTFIKRKTFTRSSETFWKCWQNVLKTLTKRSETFTKRTATFTKRSETFTKRSETFT